ncbi:MAG: hypothetical protein IIY02_00930, partial [Firmicutes bacterium]|nr:hypothetical protein [Bacillota bacterium]
MKKRRMLCLSLLLIMMLSFASCSSVDDRRNDLMAEGKTVVSCDETIYYYVKDPAPGFLRYCGTSGIGYSEISFFRGKAATVKTSFSLNEDLATLVFMNNSKPFSECWGDVVGSVYCDDEDSEMLSDLSEGKYSSYILLPDDRSGYYSLGKTLPYDLKNPSEDAFRTWTLSEGQEELKYKKGYTILGCDASGNFGVEIAKLVWDESRSVYFYYVYKPESPTAVLEGRALTEDSMALVERFLEQAEFLTPTAEVREGSLEEALAERRVVYTVGFTVVGLLLAAIL